MKSNKLKVFAAVVILIVFWKVWKEGLELYLNDGVVSHTEYVVF